MSRMLGPVRDSSQIMWAPCRSQQPRSGQMPCCDRWSLVVNVGAARMGGIEETGRSRETFVGRETDPGQQEMI